MCGVITKPSIGGEAVHLGTLYQQSMSRTPIVCCIVLLVQPQSTTRVMWINSPKHSYLAQTAIPPASSKCLGVSQTFDIQALQCMVRLMQSG